MKKIIVSRDDNNYERHNMYQEQYLNAIEILTESKIDKHYLPIINLICQYIENDLKQFIIEYDIYPDSASDMEVQHHNLKKLVEDEFFVKKFLRKQKFMNYYNLYKKEVLYFSNVLGKTTFLNSRYAIKSNKQEKSINISEINIEEIIIHWKKYKKSLAKVYYVMGINYYVDAINITNSFKQQLDEKSIYDNLKEILNKDKIDKKAIFDIIDIIKKR